MRAAALLLAAAALGACEKAPTIIDGSSREAFETTAEKARRDLPYGDRLIFDAAMKRPPGARYSAREPSDQQVRDAFDGMTAVDVVADARARGIY